MSTTDDLKATLAGQADRVGGSSPHDSVVRTVAIHERIRVVRRRRRGVAAGALAVVVAVIGLGLTTGSGKDDGPDPADDRTPVTMAGHQIPQTTSVLGFDYAYTRGFPTVNGEIELPQSDGDRVVSLVADGLGSGSATLLEDSTAVARSLDGGSLEAPVPVSPGQTSLRVKLRGAPADAEVAIAVYDRTDDLPPGVAMDGAVFRRTVGDDVLLAGAFGDPGQAAVEFSFRGNLQDVRYSDYCSTTVKGAWVFIEVDGQGVYGSECSSGSTPSEDPGAVGQADGDHRGGEVREHTVRVLLRDQDEKAITDPGVVLGGAVYVSRPSTRTVLGMATAPVVERFGRTWSYDSTIDVRPGERAVTRTFDTSRGPLLVGYVAKGDVELIASGRLSPSQRTGFSASGPTSSLPIQLLRGDDYTVTLRELRRGQPLAGSLLVYRAAD